MTWPKAHLPWFVALLAATVLALGAGASWADVAVSMKDGQLAWQVDGKRLGESGQWLQVCDLAVGEAFVTVPVSAQGGKFRGSVAELVFEGEWKPFGLAMELSCTVSAQPPRDRAIVVRVALPLQATGWTWWDDIQRKRAIEPDKHYTYVLNWGGLREVSTYPLCAVSGPEVGASLAVPLHELRVHRLACSASRQALEAEFDLGLSPEAAKLPCRAGFRVLVYAHDPRWGFRSAVERYYELFPSYAERRVGEGGIWLLSFDPGKMACPWDWGFRFEEHGEHHAGYGCAHDILPFVYTEPFGKYENFGKRGTPDGKSRWGEKGLPLTPAELKQSVLDRASKPADPKDKRAGRDREWALAEINSAIENQDGTWVWRHWTDIWSSDGSWIGNITLNDDPNLPAPSRASLTWKHELDVGAERAKQTGGELGGVYLDSVCGFMGFYNENFRREHWRYTDQPLVASRKAKQPVQLHASTCYAFGFQVAERMRAQGKFMMGNTGRPEMAWFCPILDMIGTGEHGIGLQADEHYSYMRAYGFRKPLSPMAYDLVSPDKSWDEKERAMHRMLFYAVHPGTGPFMEPAKYEPSRPLYRYYEPFIQWLDLAGWQPVTRVSVSEPGLMIERYGPGAKELADVTFVAVRNPGKADTKATIAIEDQAMAKRAQGMRQPSQDDLIAWCLVADAETTVQREAADKWTVTLRNLSADGTEVIALGPREAVARLWMLQAQKWLDRLAREARWLNSKTAAIVRGSDFEEGLAGWGTAAPPNYARAADITVDDERPLSGKRSVKIRSQSETSVHGLQQSPSLEAGQEYTLRFKYAWARPDGAKGTFTPRFGIKGPDGNWATDKYIYFHGLQPTGDTVAEFERKFTIPAGHSAGFFQFAFGGHWGTIRIDDVEITSTKLEEARQRMATLGDDARTAADALSNRLAGTGALLAAATQQEPTYQRLRDLAQSLPDAHARRCLLLPVQNFAESLGRAAEVLTGVTVHLPGGPPFGDAAFGAEAKLTCNVRAGKAVAERVSVNLEVPSAGAKTFALQPGEARAVDLRCSMPAKPLGGWEDVFVVARFSVKGQPVWLARRGTIRLHPAVQAEAAGTVSSLRKSVSLRVRSWLPAASVQLDTTARIAGQQFSLDPVRAELKPASFQDVAFPLPAALLARLDELAMRGEKCRLEWRAQGQDAAGAAEVVLVRGAQVPRLSAPPKLDGRIEPGEWAQAAKLQGFVTPQDAKPAPRATTVLLGHDGQQLYLACLCAGQPKPVAKDRGHDGNVWEDDAVEVFLQPPGSDVYYHFIVNAVGSRYDARCLKGQERSWDAAWQAKTTVGAEGWAVEMAIPLQALGAKADGLWRVNFGREEADTSRATCWSPTFASFHTPERFGEIGFQGLP